MWTALYLAGWIVAGSALLAVTRPTWYHHQLLVTVPAGSWPPSPSAAPFGNSASVARSLLHPSASASAWRHSRALLRTLLVVRFPGTADGLELRLPNFSGPGKEEVEERSLLAAINDHGAETHWLYTDRPIFAFLSGIPVPPNLAVISAKRLLTGDLTEQEILATLEADSPEMIFEFPLWPADGRGDMRTRNYRRIDETIKYRLYFRRPPP